MTARPKENGQNKNITPIRDRARSAGISTDTQWKLDRLARHNDRSFFERVVAGEISVHRACIESGIQRESTRLEKLVRLRDGASKEAATIVAQTAWPAMV